MQCPICRKPVSSGDAYMPFCSERCKLIDLGNWADEKYVFTTPASPQRPEDPSESGDGE